MKAILFNEIKTTNTKLLKGLLTFIVIIYFSINGFPQGIWMGGSTNWNLRSNWDDNQVPTGSVNVTIPTSPANGNFYPVISSLASCNNLTISPLASVTINEGITLNVSGNLSIQSNISGSGALLDNGTISISGTAAIQRYINGVQGYHYISSPLNNVTFSKIHNQIPLQNLGVGYYDPTNSYLSTHMPNIWELDETHSTPDPASMLAWLAPGSLSDFMKNMKGYVLNTNSGVTLTLDGDGSTLNTGDKSFLLTKTVVGGGAKGDGGNGWHVIGNPYPSPLDWNAIAPNLPAGVSHTICFFNPTSQYYGGFGYYHPITGPSGAYPHNQFIPSMQAFYLNTSATKTITLNNTYRTVTPAAMNTGFYKSDKSPKSKGPMIRLKGTYSDGTTSLYDETVVFFDFRADTVFNGNTDAYKMMNTEPSIPNIYAIKKGVNLAINGLPAVYDGLTVPLGFDVQASGNYSISASKIANFDSLTHIFLIDVVKNVVQELGINPLYEFKINNYDKGSRFYLRFNVTNTTGIENNTNTDIFNAYSCENNLFVNYYNAKNQPCNVSVYNMQGQTIFHADQVYNGKHEFNLNNKPGCYLVKMVTNNNATVQKVYIY